LIKEDVSEGGLPIQLYLKYPDYLVCFEVNGYKINPSYEHLSLLLDTFKQIHLRVSNL